MVLRKAMPMEDEHEAGHGQHAHPYPTPPVFPVNEQGRLEESNDSFNPGPPAAFNPSAPHEAEMHHTGISTGDVENPWAQEATDNSSNERRGYGLQSDAVEHSFIREEGVVNGQAPAFNPEIQRNPIMHQNPYGVGQDQPGGGQPVAYPGKLGSNNPFLKAAQQNTRQQHGRSWSQGEPSPGDDEGPNRQGNTQSGDNLAPLTRGLSLTDNISTSNVSSYSQPTSSTTYDTEATSWPPSTFNATDTARPSNEVPYTVPQPVFDGSHPVGGERHVAEYQGADNNTGVPLINVESATPSSSQDLLELAGNYTSGTQTGEEQARTEPEEPLPSYTQSNGVDLLADEQQRPESSISASGPNEPETSTPQPSRPITSPPSEAEIARAREKRSETYDIRHINWTDRTGVLRESPILVQNKNGPCPLLALVNGLVIRAAPNTRPPIVRALQVREKISLGLLTEALFDELTSCHRPEDPLPDIEALSSFLLMLHTGMNVNPKLTTEPNTPGKFLETNDISLYSTFKLPLVHGWLASPSTAAHVALSRVAQYHEDIQLLQFRKEELEDRVFRGGSLTQEEQQTVGDIDTIQYFVDVENATQLSAFGLDHLERSLEPGSVSILFRNDHFTTLYKHPQSNQLFTLVTDAGYASHAEIVWESLADVNGSNAELFSGDFRPVGHAPPSSRRQPPTAARDSGRNREDAGAPAPDPAPAPALPQDEQADADYAYALSLQFQDEEAQRERENTRNNRRGTNNRHTTGPSHTSAPSGSSVHNRSSSSIAHRNQSSISSRGRRSSSRQTQEVRPLIPPRVGSTDHGTTVAPATTNAAAGESADAPPPTYEQAALSPVYKPPPDHPQYDGSPDTSTERSPNRRRRSSGLDHVTPLSPRPGPVHEPGHGTMGRRPPGATASTLAAERQRERDRNKECIVM